MLILALFACSNPSVTAIVDPARPEHFFDMPFPSNDLLDEHQHVDLSGYPHATLPLADGIVSGWAKRLEMTSQGFGNNSSIYFRFDGPLTLPTETEGLPDDPVVLVAMDGSEQLPLEVRFITDPLGDPFWANNTLAMAPLLGHPPKSGGTYAAVVMRSADVAAPEGYELPEGVEEALETAGIKGKPAVATVFTVQDTTGQLRQLIADLDTRIGDWTDMSLRRVTSLQFEQGLTESGVEATIATAHYEDGNSRASHLDPVEGGNYTVDLENDWPMIVYEADIPVWNYQGDWDDRPYMSPGFSTIGDTERYTGWIDFEDGTLTSVPEVESMRIVIQIPKDANGNAIENAGVMFWDHGTGGHAYNAVQRKNPLDNSRAVAQIVADNGYALISRDATLYGTRYDLMDEGYGSMLGFYNIVNLPAFRDNQRQTAIEGHVLKRWVEQELNGLLPAGSVDPTRMRRYGHSLGSVTANLAMAADPDGYDTVFLNGSGGVFTHYFLDTGLLVDLDPELIDSLFALVGQTPPEDVTPAKAFGAILGLEEPAWANVDRLHPVMTLFQWTMDPSDPMSVARDETLPAKMLICLGDRQVPNFTSRALVEALPDATSYEIPATSPDYDPHQCLHREEPAREGLQAWFE